MDRSVLREMGLALCGIFWIVLFIGFAGTGSVIIFVTTKFFLESQLSNYGWTAIVIAMACFLCSGISIKGATSVFFGEE